MPWQISRGLVIWAAAAILLLALAQGCQRKSEARLVGYDDFQLGAPSTKFDGRDFDQDISRGQARMLIDEDHEYRVEGAGWKCELTLVFSNNKLSSVALDFGDLPPEDRVVLFSGIKTQILSQNPGLTPASRILGPDPATKDSMGYLDLRDTYGDEVSLVTMWDSVYLEYSSRP